MNGSKPYAEIADREMVEERSCRRRSGDGSFRGVAGSDYADMSNEKPGENPGRRNPKVSRGRFVRPGSVGT